MFVSVGGRNRRKRKRRERSDSKRNEEEIAAKRALYPSDGVKRKKYAILLGYNGADYYGMESITGKPTIEGELFTAMRKHKWIAEKNLNEAQHAQFQRAARTGAGVSAARQVCSLKLPADIDLDALNADLPEVIRVFAVKRVTKGFNAESNCSARTYTYTLPSVAFEHHSKELNMETYRITADVLVKVNWTLKLYEGKRHYHNFTPSTRSWDPSGERFISHFQSGEPFLSPHGIEFLTLKVRGRENFLPLQIRQMVALAIAVVRGNTDEGAMAHAFTEDILDLPIAPGLGLLFEEVHYDRYDIRYGMDGIHEPLTWEQNEPEIKQFVDKYIFDNIFETEYKQKTTLQFLDTLRNYSYEVSTGKRDEYTQTSPVIVIQQVDE